MQKAVFSMVSYEIKEGFLECNSKSLFKAEVSLSIPFEEIAIHSKYIRSHIDVSTFIITITACLLGVILLFTQFRIFTNEDLFVVLCGLILVIAIGFRILKSSLKNEFVIPTKESGELIVKSDKPNPDIVSDFLIELANSITKYNQKEYLDRI